MKICFKQMQICFIFILSVTLVTTQQIPKQDPCVCAQLTISEDCALNSKCQWTSNACAIKTTTPVDPTNAPKYCDQFNTQQTCSVNKPCSWVTKCVPFTGCSVYLKQTNDDCKAISNRCITDGSHCVELADCTTYLTQTACIVDANAKQCYWDTTTTPNTCVKATLCSQLPTTLTTADQCSSAIVNYQCTTKTGGGCIDLGAKCEDQTESIACKYTKSGTQCKWDTASNTCLDYVCTSASKTFTQDKQCTDYIGNNSCTTTKNGGCVQRAKCTDATTKNACTTDINLNKCYWNQSIGTDGQCFDLSCSNLNASLATNKDCQSQGLTTCVTTGKGCIIDSNCGSGSYNKDTCENNRVSGRTCYWNGTTCVDKLCQNASLTDFNGDNQCATFSTTLTCVGITGKGGCQNKSCTTASTDIKSTANCESYYPNNKCIALQAGGCTTLTTCDKIDIADACVKDINDKDCYWNGTTCTFFSCNSLDQQICANYNTKCIVVNSKCTDYVCNAVITQDLCTTDKNNKKCVFNQQQCGQRRCSFYNGTINYTNCNAYYPGKCIANSDKSACIDTPNICSAITLQESCVQRADGGLCFYNSGTCVDRICSYAPALANNVKYDQPTCKTFLPGCVQSDDGLTCKVFPTKCEDRKAKDYCTLDQNTLCDWDDTNLCFTKLCVNASKKSGFTVDHSNCTGYFPYLNKPEGIQCVVGKADNNNVSTCIDLPSNCSDLGQLSCLTTILLNQNGTYKNCYWNTDKKACYEIATATDCSNLYENTTGGCRNKSNYLCTLGKAQTYGCIKTESLCSSYGQDPCPVSFDSKGIQCVLNGTVCQAAACNTLTQANTSNYTNDICTSLSAACTVGETCELKQASCNSYNTQTSCESDIIGGITQCAWNGTACADASFDCTAITGSSLTSQYCQAQNSLCTVNSGGTGCIAAATNCSGTAQEKCTWTTSDGYCKYSGGSCATITDCSDLTLKTSKECANAKAGCTFITGGSGCVIDCTKKDKGPFTFDTCQAYNSICTVNVAGTACANIASTCAAADKATNCTWSTEGICDASGTACAKKTAYSTVGNCVFTASTAAWVTLAYCQKYSSTCSVNTSGTGCVTAQATCAEYNSALTSCVWASTDKVCTQYQDTSDSNKSKCQALAQTSNVYDCTKIRIDSVVAGSFTDELCQLFSSKCLKETSTNGCQSGSLAADTTPTKGTLACSDKTGLSLTLKDCQSYLKTCSVNSDGSACIDLKDTCAGYSTTQCKYSKNEGDCELVSNACAQKGCTNATVSNCLTFSNCTKYQHICTEKKQKCTDLAQFQCFQTSTFGYCTWDSTNKNCIDTDCTLAPTTNTSYSSCQLYSKICTVTLDKNNDQKGCQKITANCIDFKVKDACRTTSNNLQCYWDLVGNQCLNTQTCQTADSTHNTSDKCQKYLKYQACTVYVDKSGTLGGCIALQDCKDYQYSQQCEISSSVNADGTHVQCAWNKDAQNSTPKCQVKSCTSADDSYTTAKLCSAYMSGCTVDTDQKGCVSIPDACQKMDQNQCSSSDSTFTPKDASGNLCYWQSSGSGACVQRSCSNAPVQALDSDCSNYLSECGLPLSKCSFDKCENYTLTDDTSCSKVLTTNQCTTNGQYCVSRSTCAQALIEGACTTDINAGECQWTVPTDTTQPAYCQNKTCSTAPKDKYQSDSTCKTYSKKLNCTSTNGGGCQDRTVCANLTTSDSCLSGDINSAVCAWEETTKTCRPQKCSDVSYTSNAQCTSVKGLTCVAGPNSKCTDKGNCSSITVELGCIVGTDGPCLWVKSATGGACYRYDQCTSVLSSDDTQCKNILSQCTTNGTSCVAINTCALTNTNGGCVTGTDDVCIQSPTALQANTLICNVFKDGNCSASLYTDHESCYKYSNSKCTTDGKTGCINLNDCTAYTEAISCVYNKGVSKDDNGNILKTNTCVFDTNTQKCRDTICTDIQLGTEYLCQQVLSTCTSNGTNCIEQLSCSEYKEIYACQNGGDKAGGACAWDVDAQDATQGTCRLKLCKDIQAGITLSVCQSGDVKNQCVSDGTICVAQDKCATYQSLTSCQSQATDGICYWTAPPTGSTNPGTCAVMTNCASANNDSVACNKASDRCYFTASSGTTASSCSAHTCATYAKANSCNYFLSFDQTKYTICSKNSSGVCQETDVKTLSKDNCYKLSAYEYSWSASAQNCAQCGSSTNNPNNSNNSNDSNQSNTNSEQLLVIGIFFSLQLFV